MVRPDREKVAGFDSLYAHYREFSGFVHFIGMDGLQIFLAWYDHQPVFAFLFLVQLEKGKRGIEWLEEHYTER